jgi:hypothetical protein
MLGTRGWLTEVVENQGGINATHDASMWLHETACFEARRNKAHIHCLNVRNDIVPYFVQ